MLAEYGYQFHQHVASHAWSKEETIFETDPRLPGFDADVQVEIELTGSLDEEFIEDISREQLSIFADDDTCSLGTSHLSSEFDDDVNIDADTTTASGGNNTSRVFDSDFLTNCFINNLSEVYIQDDATSSSNSSETLHIDPVLELPVANNIQVVSDDGDCSSSSSSCSSISGSPTLQRKRRRQLDDIPWSEMSYNEKQILLETISVTVSDKLGPREQLELLRIIDPDVASLPHDGQFTIEPDFLDNEKLKRIEKLIEYHIITSSPSSKHSPSSKPRRTTSSTKSAHKKRQCKERRNQLKALRRHQRKEYNQNMKEKRSGLFQKEEVLALQSFTEEDEVDILG